MDTLINKVLEQITTDINNKDLTALAELLEFIPKENLQAYLSEE